MSYKKYGWVIPSSKLECRDTAHPKSVYLVLQGTLVDANILRCDLGDEVCVDLTVLDVCTKVGDVSL